MGYHFCNNSIEKTDPFLRHQFITLETRENEPVFQETLRKAINSLHDCAADALSSTNDSFSWPPQDSCSRTSRSILPHVAKVLKFEGQRWFLSIEDRILELFWYSV